MLSAEHLKKAWAGNSYVVVQAFGKALRGFGYTLTDDYIKTEIERYYAGEQARGGPSMFIFGWLKDGLD